MKTKLVKRHWCDFCGKAGLQAHAMAKHEKHCTLNPARYCRVCGLLGGSMVVSSERMAELVAILPDPTEFLKTPYWSDRENNPHRRLLAGLEIAMPKLREEVDGCPACILAALRQKKIPVPMVVGFDFKNEMQSIFQSRRSKDMSKGSKRRAGNGYEDGLDMIFKKQCKHEWKETNVFITFHPGAWQMKCAKCGKIGKLMNGSTEVIEDG